MARISKERQKEIRNSILDNAKTMIYENGYENTSSKDIAKAVGVAEGTLFNYFDSKQDILIEAFTREFRNNDESVTVTIKAEDLAAGVIEEFLTKMYTPMLKMPKKILIELMVAMLKLSKKNMSKLEYLISLDFKYMGDLEVLIGDLKDKGLFIADIDSKVMTESIYGVIFFELSMYLYNKDMNQEMFKNNVREKLEFLCKGYLNNG